MENEAKRHSNHVSRRTFVKGAIATTGAVVASSYVKPELRAIGVSQALAVSPGGETPPEDPPEDPPVLGHSCSLSLSVSASADPGRIWGQVCVKNESDDDGACLIDSVQVLVEAKPERGGFSGKCGDPTISLVTRSSTGGTNALGSGVVISGPTGNETCFTLEINDPLIQNMVSGDDFRVHVVVAFGPHHVQGSRTTQVCTTVDV